MALGTANVWAGASSWYKSTKPKSFFLQINEKFGIVQSCERFQNLSSGRCRHLVYSRKRWLSHFWPIGQYLPSSEKVRRVKFSVSTSPWPLVCTGASMFRWWSRNALKQRQILHWGGPMVKLAVWNEQTRIPSCRQLSCAQYFVQDTTHVVFWDTYRLSCLAHLKSTVYQIKVLVICHVIFLCSYFRNTFFYSFIKSAETPHAVETTLRIWFGCITVYET